MNMYAKRKEVTRMTEQELEKLVQDKLNEAYKANEHPHKFVVASRTVAICTMRSCRM